MKVFVSISLFFVGLLVGIGSTLLFNSPEESDASQVRQGGYALINPLLECEVGEEPVTTYTDLKEHLEGTISSLEEQEHIESVSVYFRDLNNGKSFGINEQEEFSPASLLKLPILMAFYKQAENDESLLSKKIKVDVEEDRNAWEEYTSPNYVTIGQEYTVSQLLTAMMVSSDNNAMVALMTALPFSVQDQVYQDLGIETPGPEDVKDFMTVKEYASFFRILYNASYLSKEYSERALRLMTETEFKEGLVAGVSPSVTVAHKFGERTFGDERKQLHDCGIVYLTDQPYLLCLMSRGYDYDRLAESMEIISREVYTELSSSH